MRISVEYKKAAQLRGKTERKKETNKRKYVEKT